MSAPGRPLTGDPRSHPGELPVRFHRDADKLQLLEGCSAEQMVFLSVVLGCCDVCSSLWIPRLSNTMWFCRIYHCLSSISVDDFLWLFGFLKSFYPTWNIIFCFSLQVFAGKLLRWCTIYLPCSPCLSWATLCHVTLFLICALLRCWLLVVSAL